MLIRRVVQATVRGLLIYNEGADAYADICFGRGSERNARLYCLVGLGELIAFGIFLLALLSYIHSIQKK